jgi:hypothetical protein
VSDQVSHPYQTTGRIIGLLSTNVVIIIKSKVIRWTEHVARMVEKWNM